MKRNEGEQRFQFLICVRFGSCEARCWPGPHWSGMKTCWRHEHKLPVDVRGSKTSQCLSSIIKKIGPLHDPATWYKTHFVGRKLQNKATRTDPTSPAFVLAIPLCNLYHVTGSCKGHTAASRIRKVVQCNKSINAYATIPKGIMVVADHCIVVKFASFQRDGKQSYKSVGLW